MKTAGVLCLAAVLYSATSFAGFCEDMLAFYSRKVPQLVEVTGTPEDLTFVLRSWARDRNVNSRHEAAVADLANGVARAVVSHGRNRRGIASSDTRAVNFSATISQIVFELTNNASYHGNAGAADKNVTLRVRAAEGDRVSIEISDQSGRFFDVAPLLKEMSPEEVAAAYMGVADGGRLGLNLVLQGAIQKYGFAVRSEAVTDGTGRVTGTRVVLDLDMRRALAPPGQRP